MFPLAVRATMACMSPHAETMSAVTDQDGGGGLVVPAAGPRSRLEEDMAWAIPFAIAMLCAVAVFVEQIATKTAVFQ